MDERYQTPSRSLNAARIARAQAWVSFLGPLEISCEAPTRVGHRPLRSSRRSVRGGRTTTRRGPRGRRSTGEVVWYTSAGEGRTVSPKYRTRVAGLGSGA